MIPLKIHATKVKTPTNFSCGLKNKTDFAKSPQNPNENKSREN